MKILFLICSLCYFNVGFGASPDPGDTVYFSDITPAVAAAIKAGDASALAVYFNSTMDLTLPGSEGTYSKSQAELIVKGFFASNRPEDFTINHRGSSGEGSHFCIGLLKTDNGNFRTYFLIKAINSRSVVTQLQFEEE